AKLQQTRTVPDLFLVSGDTIPQRHSVTQRITRLHPSAIEHSPSPFRHVPPAQNLPPVAHPFRGEAVQNSSTQASLFHCSTFALFSANSVLSVTSALILSLFPSS